MIDKILILLFLLTMTDVAVAADSAGGLFFRTCHHL